MSMVGGWSQFPMEEIHFGNGQVPADQWVIIRDRVIPPVRLCMRNVVSVVQAKVQAKVQAAPAAVRPGCPLVQMDRARSGALWSIATETRPASQSLPAAGARPVARGANGLHRQGRQVDVGLLLRELPYRLFALPPRFRRNPI